MCSASPVDFPTAVPPALGVSFSLGQEDPASSSSPQDFASSDSDVSRPPACENDSAESEIAGVLW